jgi:hydrogenase expression/formation protein HypE
MSGPAHFFANFRPFRLEAVLFDFDGTLTQPGAIDFDAIRGALGCPFGEPLLEYIAGVDDELQRHRLMEVLDEFEAAAAAASRPQHSAEAAVAAARSLGLKIGILTRNSLKSVERALENFSSLRASDFDVVVSREAPVPPKPRPESVEYAAAALGVPAERLLVLGDYLYDVQAGEAAGAVTALLVPAAAGDPTARPLPPEHWRVSPDFVLADLDELTHVLRMGVPLPMGKLPNDLLAGYLARLASDDPLLLVAPGVGEDLAAVDLAGEEVVVLKSDPITFATDAIGRYVVLVNANDVATSGATPRWLLTTWLFPEGSTASEILATLEELNDTCREWGITLAGGHTEITDAVTRPVVAGSLLGTVARDRLVHKRNLRSGDRLLLTKALAVEGTSVIAREFGGRLIELGMTAEEVERCATFLREVGVLEEAALAAAFGGVSAMHDVTEGGLATAAEELSIAGGHRLRVHLDRVPVHPETRRICHLLGLDPLGLLGSGSLLIAVRPEQAGALVTRLQAEGIGAVEIGEALEPGRGVEGVVDGSRVPWPRFAVDELARLFADEAGDGTVKP